MDKPTAPGSDRLPIEPTTTSTVYAVVGTYQTGTADVRLRVKEEEPIVQLTLSWRPDSTEGGEPDFLGSDLVSPS
jgi:hypothetical protein